MSTPVRSLQVVPPPTPPPAWRRALAHRPVRVLAGVLASPLAGVATIGACRLLSWAAGIDFAAWNVGALSLGGIAVVVAALVAVFAEGGR